MSSPRPSAPAAAGLRGSAQRQWRLAIVEDHLLQRRATEGLIASRPELRLVFSGETMPHFLAWLRTHGKEEPPHLLILDLMAERRPSVDPAIVRALTDSGLRILVLSAMASPPLVRAVLRAGVGGIVGKRDSEQDILQAIAAVLRRGEWLTPELAAVIAADADRPALSVQEERALVLYASGLTMEAVGATMNVRPDTAKQYLNRVRAKYADAGRQLRSKVDLAKAAWVDGYLDPNA